MGSYTFGNDRASCTSVMGETASKELEDGDRSHAAGRSEKKKIVKSDGRASCDGPDARDGKASHGQEVVGDARKSDRRDEGLNVRGRSANTGGNARPAVGTRHSAESRNLAREVID